MVNTADWAHAYALQADIDFRAWELLEEHPEALAGSGGEIPLTLGNQRATSL